MLHTNTQSICFELTIQFDELPTQRKDLLIQLTKYIQQKVDLALPINLTFICTHNSRRSHLGQVWAKTAALYYQIPNVYTYSGGTEATAFNANAIKALEHDGFTIIPDDASCLNPMYNVACGDEQIGVCYSKVFQHVSNPTSQFAAVMTCTEAESNCPFVAGADFRLALTYIDPKLSDGTSEQANTYLSRSRQIAQEMLFVFSNVKYLS
jgi:arsenate reductase